MLRRDGDAVRRAGLTLIEMAVAIGLVAIIAIVIMVSYDANASRSTTSDAIDKAAQTLSELGDAIALYTNTTSGRTQVSFSQSILANPGTLSQLTAPITTTQRNSCGRSSPLTAASLYTATQTARWTGQYFRQELPATGFLVGPGFFADDTLLRYSAVFNPAGPPYFQEQYLTASDFTTPGTLAIVMRNVRYSDAIALAQRVTGDTTAIFGAVRFTRNLTNAPVTVEYHIAIHGC